MKSDLEISFANKHHRSTFYKNLLMDNKSGAIDLLGLCNSGSVYLEEGLQLPVLVGRLEVLVVSAVEVVVEYLRRQRGSVARPWPDI